MTDKQEPVALDWSTIRDGDTLVARLEALAEARAASNSLEDDVGRIYDLGTFVHQNLPAILTALRAQSDAEVERIVAWLNQLGDLWSARQIAAMIERGEHRKDGV